MRMQAITTPTAIPAFPPGERLGGCELAVEVEVGLEVEVEVEVDVELSEARLEVEIGPPVGTAVPTLA